MFLEGCPIIVRYCTQKNLCMSVTEAKLSRGVTCAQDMLYVKQVLQSLELKMKLPVLLQMDNRGAVDLANNWSLGGEQGTLMLSNIFYGN